MINVMLTGCNGAMGQVITRLVSEKEDFDIIAGIDINNIKKNQYMVYSTPWDCNESANVMIDFSHPNALEGSLTYAISKKLPVVVATTGLMHQQHMRLREAAVEIPIFFSANMSLGVNLLIDLVSRAAKILEDNFDIEIIEKHHHKKIDAPSGTALVIADAISASLTQTKEYVYDRHSFRKQRSKNEIGIHAVRGGTIVGDHSVIFAGNDEVLEINHHAASKEIFAVGALKAAEFIVGREPGLYNMRDLVNNL